MKQNTHPRVRGEGLSHAMWARSRESWYREPCGAWPCVVRGGGWWAAAGGGWTWACGLCSSPRGVAQMTDQTCQGALGESGEGGRGKGKRLRLSTQLGATDACWLVSAYPALGALCTLPAQVTWAMLIAGCCVIFLCLGDISLGAQWSKDSRGPGWSRRGRRVRIAA